MKCAAKMALCVICSVVGSAASAQVSPAQSAYYAGVSFGRATEIQTNGCPKTSITLPDAIAAELNITCRSTLFQSMDDFQRRSSQFRSPAEVSLMRSGLADFKQCVTDIDDPAKDNTMLACFQQCALNKKVDECMDICKPAVCQKLDACKLP
jgi:hypothetical protein